LSGFGNKFVDSAVSVPGNSGGVILVKIGKMLGIHTETVVMDAIALKNSAVVAFLKTTLFFEVNYYETCS